MLRLLYDALAALVLLASAAYATYSWRSHPTGRTGQFSLIAAAGAFCLGMDELFSVHERLGHAMYYDFGWREPPGIIDRFDQGDSTGRGLAHGPDDLRVPRMPDQDDFEPFLDAGYAKRFQKRFHVAHILLSLDRVGDARRPQFQRQEIARRWHIYAEPHLLVAAREGSGKNMVGFAAGGPAEEYFDAFVEPVLIPPVARGYLLRRGLDELVHIHRHRLRRRRIGGRR